MVGCINHQGSMRSLSLGTPITVKQHEDQLCQCWVNSQISSVKAKEPSGSESNSLWLVNWSTPCIPTFCPCCTRYSGGTCCGRQLFIKAYKIISAFKKIFFLKPSTGSHPPCWNLLCPFSLSLSKPIQEGIGITENGCCQLPQQELWENCMLVINFSCVHWGLDESRVTVWPNFVFLPKVTSPR